MRELSDNIGSLWNEEEMWEGIEGSERLKGSESVGDEIREACEADESTVVCL